MDWDPGLRYWDDRKKHLPIPHVNWNDVVESTRYGDAHYKNGLSVAEIEDIELRCVDEGVELPDVHPGHKRFYLECDDVIGASKGEETKIVYSEWAKSGAVHGRPIAQAELKKKQKLKGPAQ